MPVIDGKKIKIKDMTPEQRHRYKQEKYVAWKARKETKTTAVSTKPQKKSKKQNQQLDAIQEEILETTLEPIVKVPKARFAQKPIKDMTQEELTAYRKERAQVSYEKKKAAQKEEKKQNIQRHLKGKAREVWETHFNDDDSDEDNSNGYESSMARRKNMPFSEIKETTSKFMKPRLRNMDFILVLPAIGV